MKLGFLLGNSGHVWGLRSPAQQKKLAQPAPPPPQLSPSSRPPSDRQPKSWRLWPKTSPKDVKDTLPAPASTPLPKRDRKTSKEKKTFTADEDEYMRSLFEGMSSEESRKRAQHKVEAERLAAERAEAELLEAARLEAEREEAARIEAAST